MEYLVALSVIAVVVVIVVYFMQQQNTKVLDENFGMYCPDCNGNDWMGESDWEGSLKEYRTYLINHEFLHCRPFYLEHPKRISCKVEKKLPVMYQQSRGIPKSNCKHNPWPLKHEFNK